jgi:hypothetical protein
MALTWVCEIFGMDYNKVSLWISKEVKGFHVGIKSSTKGQNAKKL